MVLNQGSIEPQGFGESVSGVRRQEILSNKSLKKSLRQTFYISNYEGFDEWSMHIWNLWGSVPPTRLRTSDLVTCVLRLGLSRSVSVSYCSVSWCVILQCVLVCHTAVCGGVSSWHTCLRETSQMGVHQAANTRKIDNRAFYSRHLFTVLFNICARYY